MQSLWQRQQFMWNTSECRGSSDKPNFSSTIYLTYEFEYYPSSTEDDEANNEAEEEEKGEEDSGKEGKKDFGVQEESSWESKDGKSEEEIEPKTMSDDKNSDGKWRKIRRELQARNYCWEQ